MNTKSLRIRPSATLAVAGLLISGLSGCVYSPPGSISLTPDEVDVEPCDQITSISVYELPTESPVTCDLAGSTLIFPDGYEITIPGIAGTRLGQHDVDGITTENELSNLGTYGVVASLRQGGDAQWWGTRQAIAKAQQANAE